MKTHKSRWTVFLDRDGVINKRWPGDYVKSWDEFRFLPGVFKAIKELSQQCEYIFIVTNQQGIAKGVMGSDDLELIHHRMKKLIRKNGGHIDAIYYCPSGADQIPSCRKPNPSMGLLAQKEYPSIKFDRSVMVGDSISDIEFGKNLGMITVYIDPGLHNEAQADYVCKDLTGFCRIFVTSIMV